MNNTEKVSQMLDQDSAATLIHAINVLRRKYSLPVEKEAVLIIHNSSDLATFKLIEKTKNFIYNEAKLSDVKFVKEKEVIEHPNDNWFFDVQIMKWFRGSKTSYYYFAMFAPWPEDKRDIFISLEWE